MKLVDKDFEQMEAFYNRTLPEAERQAYENRLSSDKEFGQAVLEYRKISKALHINSSLNFGMELKASVKFVSNAAQK